jgi:hypothetical protein
MPWYLAVVWPWDDGDDEAFREGVAISMGEVVCILSSCICGGGVMGSVWVDEMEEGEGESTLELVINNVSGAAGSSEKALLPHPSRFNIFSALQG